MPARQLQAQVDEASFGRYRLVELLGRGGMGEVWRARHGDQQPAGVAVDAGGNVYVAQYDNSRVLRMASGAINQTTARFTDLVGPSGVAVDTAGNVYVADTANGHAVKLALG